MRVFTFVASAALLFLGMSADAPAKAAGIRPAIGYYFLSGDNCIFCVSSVSVSTSTDYHLQDGTHIGSDSSWWQGPPDQANQNQPFHEYLAGILVPGVLGMAGWEAGGAIGASVGGTIIAGGGYSALTWGPFVVAIGPWVGAAAGLTAGAA